VNGDGKDDIIFPVSSNQIAVVFGATSFPASSSISSYLDGTNGFQFNLASTDKVVQTTTGDVNQDGLPDIILAGGYSSDYYIGQSTSGDVYVILGSPSFPSTVDYSDLDGTNGFVILDTGAAGVAAGDINQDGADDVIVTGNSYFYVIWGLPSSFSVSSSTVPTNLAVAIGGSQLSFNALSYLQVSGGSGVSLSITGASISPSSAGTVTWYPNGTVSLNASPSFTGWANITVNVFPNPNGTFPTFPVSIHISGGGSGTITGDPHFVGISGEQYNVRGEHNKWFNVISAPDFQMNALFKEACDHKPDLTAMTAIAIKFRLERFLYDDSGPSVNGVPLKVAPWKDSYKAIENGIEYGKFSHPYENYVDVQHSEFTVILDHQKVNHEIQKPTFVFYGENCLNWYFNLEFRDNNITSLIHGLLGQTAQHRHANTLITGNQGEGEIEGTYKDYIVSSAFSDDFKFNQYKN
jgi:hypothetical protein